MNVTSKQANKLRRGWLYTRRKATKSSYSRKALSPLSFLRDSIPPCPHPLHSNAIFVPWRCGDERMMDGWMLLVWVFHHHFPWGTLSAGREHHPKRWYLLQTRQLTDSFSLCIFPQRRAGLIWFLYGIFHYNLFDFPCSQYAIINKTLGVGTAEMLRLHTLVTLIDSHFKLSWDLIAC